MAEQIKNLIAKWDATWPSPLVVSRQHDNGQFRVNLVDYPEPENYEDQNEEILETINYYLVVWMKQSEDGEMEKLEPIQLPGPYWLVSAPYTQLVQDIKFQFYATSSVTGYIAHSAQFKGMVLESLSGSQQQSVIPEEMWDAYKQYIEDKIIGAGLATIDQTLSIQGAAAEAKATGAAIANVNGRLRELVTPSTNILNPDNILPGHFYKIVTVDGRAHIEAQENSAFSCAYVDVTPGTDYVATGISYNAYTSSADGYAVGIAYNASSSVSAPVFDSDAYNANYGNGDKTISRIYLSWRNGTYPTDTMMVVEGTTLPESYIPYGVDLNRHVGVHWSQIKDAPETDARKIYTVDINGNGDYTSFTACLQALEGDESPKTIYIKAGTYDIFAELGGQTYAESISGQGYQWFDISTVVPPNTRIIGIGEVVFEFKPTAAQIPSDVASLLSPVNVIYDIYMENITIDADNCRYCIHDETGHIDGVVETRHIYKNVKLIKKRTDVGMDAAFGCGMQRGQYMEFDGCIFSAPNRPFSFHNKGTVGYVDGTIIVIKDSVALTANNGNALRFGNVNGKQVKIDVRVLNSYLAGQIIVLNESSTERPNAYALTVVRCGNPTVTVENATNIYPPVVYA